MSDKETLYRKEAMEKRARSLFGDVILRAHPATWWITALIIIASGVVIAMLLGLRIDGLNLFEWLTR